MHVISKHTLFNLQVHIFFYEDTNWVQGHAVLIPESGPGGAKAPPSPYVAPLSLPEGFVPTVPFGSSPFHLGCGEGVVVGLGGGVGDVIN